MNFITVFTLALASFAVADSSKTNKAHAEKRCLASGEDCANSADCCSGHVILEVASKVVFRPLAILSL